MQVPPSNPVLQALSGAQEVGHTKPQPSATKADTIRAVTATEKSGGSKESHVRSRRDPDDNNPARPKPRGSIVDIIA